MKDIFLGSLIGILIVFALDTCIRLLIAYTLGMDVSVMGYASYEGLWKILLSFLTLITTFLGAYFALTYIKRKHVVMILVFGVLLIALRYGQIHSSIGMESLFFPIAALVFSLLGAGLAWKWIHRKGKLNKEHKPQYHQANEA
ncbi:MAG: hypothetical protein WD381_07735 [Balneolaceae bacterium]